MRALTYVCWSCWPTRSTRPDIGYKKQHPDGEGAWNQCQGKEGSVVSGKNPEEAGRNQRTNHGTRVVHRTMEPEDAAPLVRRRQRSEHCVARRAAQSLADAIRQTHRKDVLPHRREGD